MKVKELFFIESKNTWYPFLKSDGTINPDENNSNLGHWDKDVRIEDEPITSLKGTPIIVDGNFLLSLCYRLTSLEGAPSVVKGSVTIKNCPKISSLEGIGKDYFNQINKSLEINNKVQSNILGILKIKNLETLIIFGLNNDLRKAMNIINKHLKSGKRISKCKEELIEAGLKEFAKL